MAPQYAWYVCCSIGFKKLRGGNNLVSHNKAHYDGSTALVIMSD